MSIYEKDYTQTQASGASVAKVEFVKATYKYLAASMIAATTGAFVGMGMVEFVATNYMLLVILEFALLFGAQFARNKAGLNVLLLFAFTFLTGFTLAPLLTSFLATPAGGDIITQAFLMTALIFGVTSFYAFNTTTDLAPMGKILFVALIVLVVASLVNVFFFKSPIMQTAMSAIGAFIFTGFIAYDTQNIIKGAYDSPISAAISLYVNILNLFISLLQILGVLRSQD